MGQPLRLPDWSQEDDLSLRPPTAADVARITEIYQDPEIQRFTRVPVPYTQHDAESFVSMATGAREEGGAHLLIEPGDRASPRARCVGCAGRAALTSTFSVPRLRRHVTTRTGESRPSVYNARLATRSGRGASSVSDDVGQGELLVQCLVLPASPPPFESPGDAE
jgi:hypothetical protein